MKRAFTLTTSRLLTSALVPKASRDLLNIGDRLTAMRPLDIGPGALILPGERGTVDHVDARTGAVEVLMDKRHKGLDAWDNHVTIEPFDTDDIAGGLRFPRAQMRGRVPKWAARAAVAVCAVFAVTFAHQHFFEAQAGAAALTLLARAAIITIAIASA